MARELFWKLSPIFNALSKVTVLSSVCLAYNRLLWLSMRAEITPSVISLDSSFSKPAKSVVKAAAIVLRSTDRNGLKYCTIALFRIFSYNAAMWSCKCKSSWRSF